MRQFSELGSSFQNIFSSLSITKRDVFKNISPVVQGAEGTLRLVINVSFIDSRYSVLFEGIVPVSMHSFL